MNEIKYKNILRRIGNLFGRIEFKFFIFFISLLLLSWPFMSTSNSRSFLFYFVYYFSIWLALIIYLILSRAGEDSENKND